MIHVLYGDFVQCMRLCALPYIHNINLYTLYRAYEICLYVCRSYALYFCKYMGLCGVQMRRKASGGRRQGLNGTCYHTHTDKYTYNTVQPQQYL